MVGLFCTIEDTMGPETMWAVDDMDFNYLSQPRIDKAFRSCLTPMVFLTCKNNESEWRNIQTWP